MSCIKLVPESNLEGCGYDCILAVHSNGKAPAKLLSHVKKHLEVDSTFGAGETVVLALPNVPSCRLVVTSAKDLDPDYDDVRTIKEAAISATKKALSLGTKKPLIALAKHDRYEEAPLVTLLGVLEALYVPLQMSELKPSLVPKIQDIGVFYEDGDVQPILELAQQLDAGLRVAKDIGDADPERMSPINVQKYIEQNFSGSCIKVSIVDKEEDFRKDYPLFEAVNRAASVVPRHKGRIIFLEYSPDPSEVKETLLLVGKGVTYDTGGADIKCSGHMAGMSRDKCGAAGVAGFMEVVRQMQPKHIKVIAGLGMVRNSVGSNCYVADEVIKCRNGNLVRVGDTDAEGRMVMGDILCKMREVAMGCVNPRLFTVATLTGHACLTVGEGYTIVLDNGPAAKEKNAQRFRENGDAIGEPVETSTLRREDFAFIEKGRCFGDDILQCNSLPSSQTARGHQFPAAFLIKVAGLDKHGSGSEKPIKYSHIDIAASGGSLPNPATGSPVLALTKTYLLNPCKAQ